MRGAQNPNFKAQTSDKIQSPKPDIWGLMFGVYLGFDVSLVFGVWCLNFKPEGFRYG